jgi:hypothetical protein
MTQIAINQQIEAIRQVTAEVIKSKESALKFLKDAGIIREIPPDNTKHHAEKKKK